MKVVFLLLILSTGFVRAEDVVATAIRSSISTEGNNFWFTPEILQPKGGYLLRFSIDLTGSGTADTMFVSINSIDSKGATWIVFKKDSSGQYQKIADDVYLGYDLRVQESDGVRKYSHFVFLKPQDGGSYIGYFWLDASGSWKDDNHHLTESEQAMIDGTDKAVIGKDGLPDENRIAAKLGLGSPVTLHIEKILTAKYLQNPSGPWRDVNSKFALSQQYLDPADRSDIASLSNWNPPSNPW